MKQDYVCMEEHVQCRAGPHCSPQRVEPELLVYIQTQTLIPTNTLTLRVYLYTDTIHTLLTHPKARSSSTVTFVLHYTHA